MKKEFLYWIIAFIAMLLPVVVHSLVKIFRGNNDCPYGVCEPTLSESRNYELILYNTLTHNHPLKLYKSKKTGMLIFINENDSQTMKAQFVVVTEPLDNDGLPHALEHLIFRGSEEYPWASFIKRASVKLFTNYESMTGTHYSKYITEVSRKDPFLTMVKICMSHILFPLLSDEAYLTEVHHITKEGKDGGVVYTEMINYEIHRIILGNRALLDAAFPGECNYKNEIGGLLKNFRESTTIEKIREYHKKAYHPKNMALVVSGSIDPEDIFKVIEPYEDKFLRQNVGIEFLNPWSTPCPPLIESVETSFIFPSEDEHKGYLYLVWRVPDADSLFLLHALFSFLSQVLMDIVNKFDGLQKVKIVDNRMELRDAVIAFVAEVPMEKLNFVKEKILGYLDGIIKGTNKIDLPRLKETLASLIQNNIESPLQSNPSSVITAEEIRYWLLSRSEKELKDHLMSNSLSDCKKLIDQNEDFWKNTLKDLIQNKPFVALTGKPSKEMLENIDNEKQALVDNRKKTLGDIGLQQLGEKLQRAMDTVAAPPRQEFVDTIHYPKCTRENSFKVTHYTSDSSIQPPNFDLRQTPVYTQFDHIPAASLQMHILFDTSPLKKDDRVLIPLVLSLMTETMSTPFALWSNEFLSIQEPYGCSSYCQIVEGFYTVDYDQFNVRLSSVQSILYQYYDNLTPKIVVEKSVYILSLLEKALQDGMNLIEQVINEVTYNSDSNLHAVNMIRQKHFLQNLIKKIDEKNKTENEKIVNRIKNVIHTLLKPSNMQLYFEGSVDELTTKVPNAIDKVNSWPFKETVDIKRRSKIIGEPLNKFLITSGATDDLSIIAGSHHIESSFYKQSIPSIVDRYDKDLGALKVLISYLSMGEGLFYQTVHGNNLSNTYNVGHSVAEGSLHLELVKCSDVIKSIDEIITILTKIFSDNYIFDQSNVEKAIVTTLKNLRGFDMDLFYLSNMSLTSSVGNYDFYDFTKLAELISNVTKEDLKRVGKKYILPLTDIKNSKIAVVTSVGKVNELVTHFKEKFTKILRHSEDIYEMSIFKDES